MFIETSAKAGHNVKQVNQFMNYLQFFINFATGLNDLKALNILLSAEFYEDIAQNLPSWLALM